MIFRALLILAAFFLRPAGWLYAQEAVPKRAPPDYSSWVVYWDFANSFQQASRQAAIFSDLGVFCYQFGPDGKVMPGAPTLTDAVSKLRGLAPAETLRIWTSVANDVVQGRKRELKDPGMIHTTLQSEESRAAHIQDLLSVSTGTEGLEIDYENLHVEDREAFSDFIRELAEALHHRQQRLAVVLQPRTRDELKDGAGAIDWGAIAATADQVKVMAYHFHHANDTPGPVAPPDWVETLVRYAQTEIPPDKLTIILTVGGFDWPGNRPGRSIDYRGAVQLARLRGVRIERDPATASPHFSYRDATRHEVWFEDAQSLKRKLDVLQNLAIRHVGFWRLGAGDPEFWKRLRTN